MKKIIFILALIIIPAAAFALFYSTLPPLINHFSPRILTKYEIDNTRLRVDSISAYGAAGGITLSHESKQIAELPRIEVGFSLTSLVQKKVEKVFINGGVINLEMVDGSLQLPLAGHDTKDNRPAKPLLPIILPFLAEEITLSNTLIIIHRQDKADIELIVDGSAVIGTTPTGDRGHHLDSLQGSFTSRGDFPAALELQIDGTAEGVTVNGKLHAYNLSPLSSFFFPDALQLTGTAEMQTEITLTKAFTIQQLITELELTDLAVTGPPLTVKSPDQGTVHISLEGNSEELSYAFSQLELIHPGRGLSFFTSPAGTFNLSNFDLITTATITSPLLSAPVSVNAKGWSSGDGYRLTASLSGKYQKFNPSSLDAESGPYHVSSEIVNKDGRTSISTDMRIDSLRFAENTIDLNTISAKLTGLTEEGIFKDGKGKLDIENISYKGERLGSAAFTLSPGEDPEALEFDGTVLSGFADDLNLDVQGSIHSDKQLHAVCKIPPVSLSENSLPSFIAVDKDILFGGLISAEGEVHYPPAMGPTHLSLHLEDGYVKREKNKLDISGIAGNLTLPELPRLHSLPSQLVTVESLKLNTLAASQGNFYFRVEDDLSLFIEKSRLKWCNGKVEVSATEISPELEEFSTTMYCDRLQFSELLNQFGIPDTEGDGSLNGRLPVQFSKDGIFFDDGFLFSTPGNSGIVRFNSTNILKQGLPDMSQAAYLDYSLMALENFSYNWTKLTFNSVGNDLLIRMQIDGKPAEPLPFGYKNGHIVATSKGKGIQHPLQLTVNFNLPIKEMFRYGQNFQKIMEKM